MDDYFSFFEKHLNSISNNTTLIGECFLDPNPVRFLDLTRSVSGSCSRPCYCILPWLPTITPVASRFSPRSVWSLLLYVQDTDQRDKPKTDFNGCLSVLESRSRPTCYSTRFGSRLQALLFESMNVLLLYCPDTNLKTRTKI